MHEEDNYESIRQRVGARYKRRKKLLSDILITLTITAIMWVAWISTDPVRRMGAPVLLLLNGVILLVLIRTFAGFVLSEMEERAVLREIEREREWQLSLYEKAKNDERLVRLSHDGELVEMTADFPRANHRGK